MKITSLDIRDIGIIQGEKLDNLGNGIVVIGGLNRAGKTTFMEVIRHLGYGFSKGDSIPPPSIQYEVRGDVITEEGEDYRINIQGYSSPEVKSLHNGKEATLSEIFNNIDSHTYKQLFTISLDELRKLSSKDNYNIQSALIGAGLKDIVKLPNIMREINKEREKIGGKRGTPSTKLFKPYNASIKEGLQLKKKALEELGEYREKKEELVITKNNINDETHKLEKLQSEIIVLDVMKNIYNSYNEMLESERKLHGYNFSQGEQYKNLDLIGSDLYTDYKNAINNYNEKFIVYKSEVSDSYESVKVLLHNKNNIEKYYMNISGLKEKISNLHNEKERLQRKYNEILSRMSSINKEWNNFSELKEIHCDEISYGILQENISKYNELKSEKREYEKEIEVLEKDKSVLSEKLKGYNNEKESKYIKLYILINVIMIIIGMGVSYFNSTLGLALIIVSALGSGLSIFISYNMNSVKVAQFRELEGKLKEVEKSINFIHEKKKNIFNEITKYEERFEEYRENLKVTEYLSTEGIKEYYKYLLHIKREIYEYEQDKMSIIPKYENLQLEIDSITNFIENFSFLVNYNPQENHKISSHEEIFESLDILNKALEYSEELKRAEEKVKLLEEKIKMTFNISYDVVDYLSTITEYIEKGKEYREYFSLKQNYEILKQKIMQVLGSERTRESIEHFAREKLQNMSMDYSNSGESHMLILKELYKNYSSLSEIEEEYSNSLNKKNIILEIIDELKNKAERIKYQLQRLSSDESIEKAHKVINEGRERLKPLAEKYALYSTAYYMLEKIQKRFLQDTKDTLLAQGAEYLKQITSGEIKGIEPSDDILEFDFKTVNNKGNVYNSSSMLSRGTGEQLYLAVRMGKIKEIVLPVVFDDSFVNFDAKHVLGVVKVLNELSKTHQIFVLTCHPNVVQYISQVNHSAQYWKVHSGKFSLSTSEELIRYLNI